MKFLLPLSFLLFLYVPLFAQNSSRADSLNQLLEQASTETERIDRLYDLGYELLNTNRNRATEIASEMQERLNALDYPEGKLKTLTLRGSLEVNNGENQEAIALAQEALELAIKQEAPIFQQRNHIILAAAYFRMGDSKTSLDHAFKALNISEDQKDLSGAAIAYYTIGNNYWQILDHTKAKQYYLKAKEIFEEIGEKKYLGNIYNNLVNVEDDLDLQKEYAQKALAIFEETGHQHGMAFVNSTIGSIYHDDPESPDPQKALEHYLVAAEIWEEIQYEVGLISIYGNIGSAYIDLGQTQEALPYLEKALKIALEEGGESEISDIYYYYFQAYGAAKDFDKAKMAIDSHRVYLERTYDAERASAVADAEAKYQNEKTALELEQQKNRQKNIIIIAIVALLLIAGLFQFLRYRQQLKHKEAELALQIERSEAEKLRELDRLKSNFFANISHEFRTPLTLILSPLKQMIQGSFQGDRQKYYRIMQRNGRRLLDLINQLLDLSKLEGGRMQLQTTERDLGAFVRAIAYSFESLAERRQVALQVKTPENPMSAWFDPDKLEKILSNLLSNAFKFTSEGGQVSVHLQEKDKGWAQISVQDTGIGVSAEHLPHIFDRFYSQGQAESELGSTGIGLALTKELIELHRGKIELSSKEREGTTFTLHFPIQKNAYSEKEKILEETTSSEQLYPTPDAALSPNEAKTISPLALSDKKPIVLLVEDNPDVRVYVKDQLLEEFQVLEAEHGKKGLTTALEKIPDLIITDLMMPEMDGVALCQKLKTDERTSHIPVIMLTAKAEREDKLEGLQTGADDYLIKPFDAEELLVRMNNLITQRRRLRERFQNETVFKPKEVAVTSVDEAFLKRVLETIEKEMEEETFSVVELSQAVGMSRSQLHRKLKALTDKSPNQIIREMRLQRAKELLTKGAGNASEVAFMVGFNSLAYFSRCFKDQFGVSPSSL